MAVLALFILGALHVLGCSTGRGEGTATGQVWAPECGLDAEPFSLDPNFFAMQPSTTVEIIDIRIQRGSDIPNLSNGISVFIAEPEMVKDEMLGIEIPLERFDPAVEMTVYLNSTCPTDIPVVYRSISGTIQFDELFVPWVSNDNRITTAVFTDVLFVDTDDPENRRAVLSGDFTFLYQRGRPAQNFSF
ncbi:MAG: hypothetical protein AAF500_09845 [Myxococcota bacterium]